MRNDGGLLPFLTVADMETPNTRDRVDLVGHMPPLELSRDTLRSRPEGSTIYPSRRSLTALEAATLAEVDGITMPSDTSSRGTIWPPVTPTDTLDERVLADTRATEMPCPSPSLESNRPEVTVV